MSVLCHIVHSMLHFYSFIYLSRTLRIVAKMFHKNIIILKCSVTVFLSAIHYSFLFQSFLKKESLGVNLCSIEPRRFSWEFSLFLFILCIYFKYYYIILILISNPDAYIELKIYIFKIKWIKNYSNLVNDNFILILKFYIFT